MIDPLPEAPPLRVIQVGCGQMGRGWIEAVKKVPEVELVGVVDVSPPTADAAAVAAGLPSTAVYDNLAVAVRQTGATAVFDVTVPGAHEGVVTEALSLGCHVLGEKPMSESLDAARRMVAAAATAGRTYAVVQNYRYTSGIRTLQRLLVGGGIGPVQEVHADFFIGPRFGGFRDEMAHPLLLDMAIHTFDAARFLSGADPVSVYCHGFNPARSWYKGDASAVAIFEMTGGLVFSYRGSWCADGLATNWGGSWRVVGGAGTATWDGGDAVAAAALVPDGPPKFLRDTAPVPIEAVPMMTLSGHAALIREFADAVRDGRRPETDCTDNIKSLAMVFAAVESARTGAKVRIDR
jgi:predicted dehydrogenase